MINSDLVEKNSSIDDLCRCLNQYSLFKTNIEAFFVGQVIACLPESWYCFTAATQLLQEKVGREIRARYDRDSSEIPETYNRDTRKIYFHEKNRVFRFFYETCQY